MKAALAVFVSLLALTGSARAGLVEPGDNVPGHPGVAYYDLMKLVVTDLERDLQDSPTAQKVVPYRRSAVVAPTRLYKMVDASYGGIDAHRGSRRGNFFRLYVFDAVRSRPGST